MKNIYQAITEVTDRANQLYGDRKIAKHGPEGEFAKIRSDQVWAMMQAIVEHFGARLEVLEDAEKSRSDSAEISYQRGHMGHAVEFDYGGES